MLLGVAMVMVLFENEWNAVHENELAFSTLGVDPMRLLSAGCAAQPTSAVLDLASHTRETENQCEKGPQTPVNPEVLTS